MIVRLTGHEACAERSGTYLTKKDGAECWAAYIQLAILKTTEGPLYAIVEGYGPSEVQAAERCMTKAKMLGDVMTLAIQEGFWGVMRRAEAAAQDRTFKSIGKSLIFAEGDDDKDEPS